MTRAEYQLSAVVLRIIAWFARLWPIRRRVVIATARLPRLEGNLAFLHAAIRRRYPSMPCILLLEPYGYGLAARLAYLLRVARGMWYVQTSRLVIVDNAYLPIHVARHRAGTVVVQVWHAVGALKRFGADTVIPLGEPEQTFLHRNYDLVVSAGEASREPYSRALRTPVSAVLGLGTPRTDFFFDPVALDLARSRVLTRYPLLAGRRVVTYAPTFRGRGKRRWSPLDLDATTLRAALPDSDVLVVKHHPNLPLGRGPTAGFDVVIDPGEEMNDVLAATDVLITDFSSSIFEFALLRRPMILLVADLDEYERDPGLYVDYRSEMIGCMATNTGDVLRALLEPPRLDGYDAFIARHLGACDGSASDRIAERLLA